MYLRRQQSANVPPRRRWGHSDPRASIGFEREISVEVYPDHLIVGGAYLVRTEKARTPDQISVWMLEAIERTARSWGWPPKSFYWVPTLKFRVAYGAESLYRGLDATAADWRLQRQTERIETQDTPAGDQP